MPSSGGSVFGSVTRTSFAFRNPSSTLYHHNLVMPLKGHYLRAPVDARCQRPSKSEGTNRTVEATQHCEPVWPSGKALGW